jgi:putative ABC transport system substrate-binding protein
MGAHLKTLVDLALKQRLPTISEIAGLAAQGGLMSYGYNLNDAVRAAAGIVDKILRGANVSEIPVEQATTFRLVINLKTAKALGLTIPPSLLGRADEVLQ